MKDFGNDDYSDDCLENAEKIKGLDCSNAKDFIEILKTINRDLNLGLDDNDNETSFVQSCPPKPKGEVKPNLIPQSEIPQKEKPYSIVQQSFSEKEMVFWRQYGITPEMLKTYKVLSLKEFRSENSDGKPFSYKSFGDEPMFGYAGKKHVKIYRPFSQNRFLYGGNIPEHYCFGLEQLPIKGDTLFITGGEKDVLSLVSHGFHAVCFNSETSNIPQGIIKKLSYRFKHIILLYDTDKTGLDSSLKHTQQLEDLGVKRLILPLAGTKQEKDISDYFRLRNTRENFRQLFIEFLDNLYSETMSILKPCEIDFNHPPIESEMLVSIHDVPLGTQGNLLGITGSEGTGKSHYSSSLIAGTLCKVNSSVDTLGTSVQRNTTGKAVLLYDTEQSEVQLYKNITVLLKRAKLSSMPCCLKAYSLTSISRRERMQAIIESMDRFYYRFSGIQMVVIDGIADLVRCANDEAESIAVIDELYRLAGIYKTCIICVLHFVPNGLKLRGHLGSELQRKAAAILSIEQDENPQVSVVKAMKVRQGSPLDVPLIQFAWDKASGMHAFLGEKSKEEKEKRKENELSGVVKTIFSKRRYCTYVDLCGQIQSILEVKERTAKSYIRFMREREIILKDPSNASYFIIGHSNG
jgi:archaellum biogenesis ATPase FlaH